MLLPAISPVSSFLSLLSHEAELESWERLEVAVSSLLLEQCLVSLGWQDTAGLAAIIFRLTVLVNIAIYCPQILNMLARTWKTLNTI